MKKQLLIIFLITISVVSISCSDKKAINESKSDETKEILTEIKDSVKYDYYVYSEDIHNGLDKTYVSQKVILKSDSISEKNVESLMLLLTKSADTHSKITNKSNPIKIVILLYTSENKANNGMGDWLARSFKKENETTPEITISDTHINSQFTKKEEVKFGLSEQVRKEIFKELVLLEDKSSYEAEKKYPIVNRGNTIEEINNFKKIAEKNIDKNYKYEEDLIKKYKSSLIKKYKITSDILESISRESFDENWELPVNPYKNKK